MENKKVFEKLKQSPNGVRYEELTHFAEALGFAYKGGHGSHKVFIKPGVQEILNFQNVHGLVKPYQVKQFIKIIEKYNLLED